jgi:hypothetical protein
MLTPAVVGGIVIAGGSSIPFLNFLNCFCCAWVVLGGMVASYMYIRESPQRVTLGDGAILGAYAALAGSLFGTLLSIPFKLMMPGKASMIRDRLESVNMPEEVRSFVLKMIASGGLSVIGLIFQFFAWLIIGLIFATLGGIIGAAAFEKRKNGGTLPPPPQPPFPPVPPVVPPPGL